MKLTLFGIDIKDSALLRRQRGRIVQHRAARHGCRHNRADVERLLLFALPVDALKLPSVPTIESPTRRITGGASNTSVTSNRASRHEAVVSAETLCCASIVTSSRDVQEHISALPPPSAPVSLWDSDATMPPIPFSRNRASSPAAYSEGSGCPMSVYTGSFWKDSENGSPPRS